MKEQLWRAPGIYYNRNLESENYYEVTLYPWMMA